MTFFEWDEVKSASNLRKHGIDFHEAARVFLDEFALIELNSILAAETRWSITGMLDGKVVLVVIHTVTETGSDETIRVISARQAGAKERKRYGQNRSKDVG